MSSELSVETKESQTDSANNVVGVASNTEVDVNVAKTSTVSTSDNKEELINEVFNTLTPMVKEFVANAVKVVGQTVTDIVEYIWNEWKEFGALQKILVVIAAAMIVGGVGAAAGCGAWYVIGGNWETIKKAANHAMKYLEENPTQLLKQLNSNVVVKKLQIPFAKKSETNSAKIEDVKNLVKSGHGKVIMALLDGLPIFVTGIDTLGELEDEAKVELKKDNENRLQEEREEDAIIDNGEN